MKGSDRVGTFWRESIKAAVGLWLGLFLATQADRALADSANEAGDACACSERAALATDLLPPMNGNAADFAERRSGAAADARIRIAVDHQAVYQVNAADLVARGVALSDLVGARLRLYNRDREIPIEVSTSGTFGAGDSFRFYGEGIDATYTYDNAYWLATRDPAGSTAPLRWTSVPGSVITTAGTPAITNACRSYTVDDHIQRSTTSSASNDGWILSLIANIPLLGVINTYTNAIPAPGTANLAGDAELRVTMVPRTSIGDTDFNVAVRNSLGSDLTSTTFSIPSVTNGIRESLTFATAIQPGLIDGQLVFDSNGEDLYDLDSFRLRYDRVLEPVNGTLGFGGVSGAANYTISSANGGNATLLDISNPTVPVVVQGAAAGTTYSFGHVAGSTNAPCFFYSEQDEAVSVASITVAECVNLADPRRQADWILIAPEAWLGAQGLGDLLRHRAGYSNPGLPAATPLNVLAVSVESIYNEFGYGVKDAAAIKQFLGYAHHHFQAPAPRFVLLAGDASFDARQDVYPEPDWIPAWYDPDISFAASDSWYAQVAGPDRVADFSLGRWPVRSAAEFDGVAAKTIAADLQAADAFRKRVMLVYDEPLTEAGIVVTNFTDCPFTIAMNCVDFIKQRDRIVTNVPAPYTVDVQALASNGGNVFAINQSILTAFSQPLFQPPSQRFGVIDGFAHMGRGKWGLKNYAEAMFNSDDADVLVNSSFPIVTMYGSQAGSFTTDNENGGRSVAVRLLVNPNGGAAGVMGNTWLFDSPVVELLQASFYANLQAGTGQRLGDLWLAQSQDAGAVFPQPTGAVAAGEGSFGQWTLLADPALMLP